MTRMLLAALAASPQTLEESRRALEDSQRPLQDSQLQLFATGLAFALLGVAALLNLLKLFPERLPRRTRRVLVAGVVAALGAIVFLFSLPDDHPLLQAAFAWIAVAFFLVNWGLRRWTYVFEKELDERQREQVMNAQRSAYMLVGATPLFAFLILFRSWWLAWFRQLPGELLPLSISISLTRASYLALFLTFFISAVPGLVLAWREPDPTQEAARAA